MAHEITRTDQVVLHKRAAWHGLGIVVEEAPTTLEALRMAGLDWTVEQLPLEAWDKASGTNIPVDSHMLNIRSDNHEPLGVVGSGWSPIQNHEALVDFVDALASEGSSLGVKVETMGSIQGGRKVWTLARGDQFKIGTKGDDHAYPYLLVAMGHDGSMALRVLPTTIRVVCRNTLDAAAGNGTGWKAAAYTVRHSGDTQIKVEEAKAALALFDSSIAETKNLIGCLSSRDVDRRDIEAFWLDVYTRQFGGIPANPGDRSEERRREKGIDAFASMTERFDTESQKFGATAWIAANAYTGWLQHDLAARGKDHQARREAKVNSNIFGVNSARTREAMKVALQLA